MASSRVLCLFVSKSASDPLFKQSGASTVTFLRHSSDDKKRDLVNQSRVRGIDVLRNPKLNKGTAFTLRERQLMGIHGLIPPAVRTFEEQTKRVMTNFNKRSSDLDRFIYLMSLSDRNEKLFYKVLCDNVDVMMPIVYTPTVGLACQQYGTVFRRPRGLFISIKDKGHIYEILCNWPEREVKAVVVTDGERILGLGDLGAYGMGIPVGKLSLYTALGGIDPSCCLPILLDVGTNNEELRKDPLYIGRPYKRVTGEDYDEFIDEFMVAIVKRYGSTCLVQFEDFGNHNAFRFLDKYRENYCTFNDDIQGTAAVAVAGIHTSLRVTGKKLTENTFLFLGAGEAALGIADLLCLAMQEEGASLEEARSKVWMVDIDGLLTVEREDLKGRKAAAYAKDHKTKTTLQELVDEIKPTTLIGASACAGAFNQQILKSMGTYNERPVIFALSNPTSKAECSAEQAYEATEGRCVFASGSPFPPHTMNGRTFYPGQGNNAYIFPGVALGLITCGVKVVPDRIFLQSARQLSKLVTDEHIAEGRVYPPLEHIKEVSVAIAVDLAEYVYRENLATTYPEPKDKEEFIRSKMYLTEYECFEPETWEWPED